MARRPIKANDSARNRPKTKTTNKPPKVDVVHDVIERIKSTGPCVLEWIAIEGSRELVTVDVPYPGGRIPTFPSGSIIRLRPRANATEEQIRDVVRAAVVDGVVRVDVQPQPVADTVPDGVVAAQGEHQHDIRSAVDVLVAASTGDKIAIRKLTDTLMAKVGI